MSEKSYRVVFMSSYRNSKGSHEVFTHHPSSATVCIDVANMDFDDFMQTLADSGALPENKAIPELFVWRRDPEGAYPVIVCEKRTLVPVLGLIVKNEVTP